MVLLLLLAALVAHASVEVIRSRPKCPCLNSHLCSPYAFSLPAGYNLGTVLYAHACALQEALLASQEQAEAAQQAGAASGGGRPAGAGLSSPTAGGRGKGQQLASERAIQSTFAHAAQ